jgi:hypothetical protein
MVAAVSNPVGSDSEGMLRAAEMSLIQLYIPVEVAQYTIAELGDLGICQFKDVLLSVFTLIWRL